MAQAVQNHLQQQATQQLQEAVANEAAAAQLGMPPHRRRQLHALVADLRAQEADEAFHARLASAVQDACQSSSYSVDNFAYGSTPFASFARVFEQPCIKAAAAAAMAPPPGTDPSPPRVFMVWGSSCGWLPLFGALAYGWRGVGYELLPPLAQTAQAAARGQQLDVGEWALLLKALLYYHACGSSRCSDML